MRIQPFPLHRLVLAAAAAGLALTGLALTGCTGDPAPPTDPSLSATPPAATPTSSSSAGAVAEGSPDDLLACLSAAGIPASLRDLGADGKKIVFEPETWVINRDPAGQVVVSYTDDTAVLTADQEADWLKPYGPVLVIDGQDHTAGYTACLTEAGSPAGQPNPAATSADGQIDAIADASAAWATCARQNGHPDIADPEPAPAGGLPEVVIPVTITSEQLETLLNTCPPFDADAFQKAKDAWAEGDTTYPAPVFPYLTVSPSDGTETGEQARIELLELINQAQAEALNQ